MVNIEIIEEPRVPTQWVLHNHALEAPIDQIAEDSSQPRTHFGEMPLEELADNIRENGVRQPAIITPRHLAPWIPVAPEDEEKFFVMVAGARRKRASTIAGKTTLPTIIRIYANEEEHERDLLITNVPGVELSEIEQARRIHILREKGRDWSQIASLLGIGEQTCKKRLKLLQLATEIVIRELDPSISPKERLGMGLAETLADLRIETVDQLQRLIERFDSVISLDTLRNEEDPRELLHLHQRIWLAEIRKRGLSDAQAISLIESGQFSFGGTGAQHRSGRSEKHQPRKRKEILQNYLNAIMGGVPTEWPQEEIDRILYNTPKEELSGLLEDAYQAKAKLFELLDRLETTKRKKR